MSPDNSENFGARLYLFDKPAGISTFDVIRRVKRYISIKGEKVGHFGTLDPFATGLVIVGVGGASRLNDLAHELLPKTYLAKGLLGVETPTGDMTVDVSREESISDELRSYSIKEFEQTWLSFCEEEYWQRPPAFSAAKFEGKALHEWAREGKIIEKEAVLRKIYSIELNEIGLPILQFRSTVGTGTYIRVLFQDMAKKIGTIGTLKELRREAIGKIDLSMAQPLKDRGEEACYEFISPRELLSFDEYILSEGQVKRFCNGNPVRVGESEKRSSGEHASGQYGWASCENGLLYGLGKFVAGELAPKINFRRP